VLSDLAVQLERTVWPAGAAPAFCAKILEEFAEGRHPAQARSA
jgi:hypothetical protein